MNSKLETRLRRLEGKVSDGLDTILVVEKLGDEKAFESFRRGLVDIVIATGVPRCQGSYPGKDRAPEDSKRKPGWRAAYVLWKRETKGLEIALICPKKAKPQSVGALYGFLIGNRIPSRTTRLMILSFHRSCQAASGPGEPLWDYCNRCRGSRREPK
jgi:hypothetical protein